MHLLSQGSKARLATDVWDADNVDSLGGARLQIVTGCRLIFSRWLPRLAREAAWPSRGMDVVNSLGMFLSLELGICSVAVEINPVLEEEIRPAR